MFDTKMIVSVAAGLILAALVERFVITPLADKVAASLELDN